MGSVCLRVCVSARACVPVLNLVVVSPSIPVANCCVALDMFTPLMRTHRAHSVVLGRFTPHVRTYRTHDVKPLLPARAHTHTGLIDVIPERVLRIFEPAELQAIVSGPVVCICVCVYV